MKHLQIIKYKLSSQPTFGINDVKKLLPNASTAYIHLLLHNLIKTKRIFRITRGIYTFHDEITVCTFAFSPSYLGLQQALSIHNLWEQETNPVILTTRKMRSGIRKFDGNNYVVRRITRKMFFGYELTKYSGVWVSVSDVEKTLIDMIYYKQYMSAELKEEFLKKINKTKLKSYLKCVSPRLQKKVLNFLK